MDNGFPPEVRTSFNTSVVRRQVLTTLEVGIYDATTKSYAYSSVFSGITTAPQSQNPSDPADPSAPTATWQVTGFGEFAGTGASEMLLRTAAAANSRSSTSVATPGSDASGASTTSNAAISLGQVGLNWQIVGFGDFSGNANETDMLMQNTNTGDFEVYDISNNAVSYAARFGQVDLNWQIAGFGDFSGNPNETDMLVRDSNTGSLRSLRHQP